MKNETRGTLLAIAAAIVSGLAIPANKLFIVDIDPLVFTALRSLLIGTGFLLVMYLASGRTRSAGHKLWKLPWKHAIAIAAIGGSAAFLLFFSGLQLTTAGRAAFLQKTLPLYVTVFAVLFLGEKISAKHAGAVLAMAAGTAAVYFASIAPGGLWTNPSLGDILVISATVMWAAEAVISKHAMNKGAGNIEVSFSRMFLGGIMLMASLILAGKSSVLLAMSAYQWTSILASTAILFAYVLFWFWSIRMINVSKAASLLLIAPVISLSAGAAFLGEPVPLLQAAGCAAIVAGAFMMSGTRSETNDN